MPASTHDQFWTMLAHTHGQVCNGARFAASFGVAATTVRSSLDLLTSALVVDQLRPWFENVNKRQVKSPKVYIADSGLLHAPLDLADRTAIERHPILGASWGPLSTSPRPGSSPPSTASPGGNLTGWWVR